MDQFLGIYFLETGLGWAVLGAMLAVTLGGVGSALGIRVAAAQAAGVLSEKPELFGKLFVMIALPGTQGFYGFICAIIMALRSGLITGQIVVTPIIGVALFAIGAFMGIVQWKTAIVQGEVSAAAINYTGKQPGESGRALILPALVETYAVIALLAAILLILWVTKEGGLSFPK